MAEAVIAKVEDQENAEETQATEEQLSAVEDLTDEEVAKLANGESLPVEKADETKGADAPVKEGDADTEPAEEAASTEEPAKEELKEGEAKKAETTDEQVSVSKVKWDELQAHAKTQADYEKRIDNEVGSLRKKVQELTTENLNMLPKGEEFTTAEKEKLDELASTDMLAWRKEVERLEGEKKAVRESLVQGQKDQASEQQLTYLESHSPDWKDSQEEVKTYLEGGLLNATQAAEFVGNPSGWQFGGFIMRVAMDAAKNQTLKTEVADLTKKLSSLQDNIATNVSKPGTMQNLGTGTIDTKAGDEPTLEDVENLSDAELAKLLPKPK